MAGGQAWVAKKLADLLASVRPAPIEDAAKLMRVNGGAWGDLDAHLA
ncbi:MAG TPA: hypothetical protein VG650_08525 [Mycobacteriales bacterium]|nr:hypothetical protein [Mycobacteriales bacterium]